MPTLSIDAIQQRIAQRDSDLQTLRKELEARRSRLQSLKQRRMVGQRAGWLLVYSVVSLLSDWLDLTSQPIVHLGGFVFGLVGGFLCGHKLQPRAARWRLWRLGVVVAICAGLIGLTAWGVNTCSSKALEYYQAYAAIKDRDRELRGRFQDLILQWEQHKLTNAECSQALQSRLIPALQEMRSAQSLKPTEGSAEMEKHIFSMQEFWKELRAMRGEAKDRDKNPLTLKESGTMYGFLCKVRVDTWRALADELNNTHPFVMRALLDDHELDMLVSALDHEVNEDNPLYRWFERTRAGRRQDRQDAGEPDGGLLKNRGFEAGLEGWTAYSMDGPHPRFKFDTEVVREGRQALRVTASQPVNVACYQEVMLKPGQWYRFSGWVRTRGLNPCGSSVYGTFRVHARGVNDIIAKGDNYGGDTEWTRVSLTFQARGDGLTRIVLFFVGFGQGTGTAWFDDLGLVEVSQPARQKRIRGIGNEALLDETALHRGSARASSCPLRHPACEIEWISPNGRRHSGDQKCRLKSIVGVVLVLKDAATNSQDHGPMSLQKRFKWCFIAPTEVGFE